MPTRYIGWFQIIWYWLILIPARTAPTNRPRKYLMVMKNSCLWRWLATLLLALNISISYADEVPAMRAKQVSASAWYVEGASALGTPANQNFISNAAFVVTPAGVVLIDALGSPALATRLIAEIAKVTPQPITHVIVTHLT